MKILAWIALTGAALAAAAAVSAQVRREPAMVVRGESCAALSGLDLPHVAITAADLVPAADQMPGAHPAYCRVAGTARPTSDSDIRFEVWIPADGAWNHRYLQVGNGGFAGAIPQAALAAAIAQGYAVAGTDDGHQSQINTDASWALHHREKQIDFGYRALKETTDAAKAIIAAYAGSAPRHSYFQGCSDGGREALMEAQRYPGDFDGIVAGDPANHWTHLLSGAVWNYQALTRTPESWLSPGKLKLVEAEALKQCGDVDGVIQDPEGCNFRPEKLRCANGDAPDCLTGAQLATLAKIYSGPRNPRTGEKILSGFSPGGEAEANGWVRWITGTVPDDKTALIYQFASNYFRYIVHADPDYDISTMNMDGDVAAADKDFGPVFNSYGADLSAFQKRGGKLIQYHGWADPAIPALDSVDYYKSVQAAMGDTHGFYRLFLAPGMLHCGGGPGPNVLSTLPAITRWVEQGEAPDRLMATKYQDNDISKPVVRTRPLCPYPARAVWDGTGDRNGTESYLCKAGKQ